MSICPKIAIIGGGPGGLTLARILHIHGISATVFEKELNQLARPQGGSLDMHPETGQFALQRAGLTDAFQRRARFGDQGNRVYRPDGKLLFDDANLDGNRPEIDRAHLRQLLLDSLPPTTVRWAQEIDMIQENASGQYSIVTNGCTVGNFDLVVGADGAWSCVRPLVSPAHPYYEGVIVADLGIDDADNQYPAIAAMVGHGKVFAKGKSKTLAAQRNANGHIRVYAALRLGENDIIFDHDDHARTKRELIENFADFAPELLRMITVGHLNAVRPLYALPIGHRWTNRPGITLIGDAAHLMSPFGGEGANSAMADAADLAMAIIEAADWKGAVAGFEENMFARAENAARGASEGLKGAVSDNAPEHVFTHMAAVRERLNRDTPRTLPVTPKETFDTLIAEKTRNQELIKNVNAVYRFDLSGPNGGTWIVDFTADTAGIRRTDEEGQCTIEMTDVAFVSMATGRVDPKTAFMTGKLKFKGDMSLAMKLGHLLGAATVT